MDCILLTFLKKGSLVVQSRDMVLTARQQWRQRMLALAGRGLLLLLTSVTALAVLLIIGYIARDAFPFFRERFGGIRRRAARSDRRGLRARWRDDSRGPLRNARIRRRL